MITLNKWWVGDWSHEGEVVDVMIPVDVPGLYRSLFLMECSRRLLMLTLAMFAQVAREQALATVVAKLHVGPNVKEQPLR